MFKRIFLIFIKLIKFYEQLIIVIHKEDNILLLNFIFNFHLKFIFNEKNIYECKLL